MSLVIANETPRARIRHQCGACRRSILPGEKYSRQRGVFEGDPYVSKWCTQCHALVMDLWAHDFRGYYDDWTLPDLPDFDDWAEVHQLGLVWGRRHFLYTRQWNWRGRLMDYPVEVHA